MEERWVQRRFFCRGYAFKRKRFVPVNGEKKKGKKEKKKKGRFAEPKVELTRQIDASVTEICRGGKR